MKKLRVLLVDDEERFLSTLATRLEFRGFMPWMALDGQQAIQLMEDQSFDVVLLDVMMPALSGLEVLQQIKRDNPELPVILLTGKGSIREGMEGMRCGAYDYLMKPVDIKELEAKLRDAVHPDQAEAKDSSAHNTGP